MTGDFDHRHNETTTWRWRDGVMTHWCNLCGRSIYGRHIEYWRMIVDKDYIDHLCLGCATRVGIRWEDTLSDGSEA